MRPDGDPDRDDYGLPRVDVVIPDDARELDRDLIAYRREQRQLRRRMWLRRIFGPLVRYGPAVPVIGGALIIALVSAVMVTVVGPRQMTHQLEPTASAAPAAGQVGGPLPAGEVDVSGVIRPISDLRGIIIVVPAVCDCQRTVQGLLVQADQAGVATALVGSGPWTNTTSTLLTRLAGSVAAGTDDAPAIVRDPANTLATTFRASGLTVLAVSGDDVVQRIYRNQETTGLRLPAEVVRLVQGGGNGRVSPAP